MKKLLVLPTVFGVPLLILAALAVAFPTAAGALPAGDGGMDGKAIFLAQKCDMCHSVSTAGIEAKSKAMKAPDLAGVVTAEHDAKWIGEFLHKQADLNGKKHGKTFTGSDEELKALISWLAEQKK
jgi:cytochrome c5